MSGAVWNDRDCPTREEVGLTFSDTHPWCDFLRSALYSAPSKGGPPLIPKFQAEITIGGITCEMRLVSIDERWNYHDTGINTKWHLLRAKP